MDSVTIGVIVCIIGVLALALIGAVIMICVEADAYKNNAGIYDDII